MVALIIFYRVRYRKEYMRSTAAISPSLLKQLESEAQIENRSILVKALVVGFVIFVMFFVADKATLLTTWITAVASAIIANIPFTVAALPATDFLSTSIAAASQSGIVYWGLILGADLGGNATILGSAPNIVAAGLLAHADCRVNFGRFMRDGIPVTIITLLIASIWLMLRYYQEKANGISIMRNSRGRGEHRRSGQSNLTCYRTR